MGGQNIVNTAEGLNGDGKPFKVVFQHIYDGQPHPNNRNRGLRLQRLHADRRIFKLVHRRRVLSGIVLTFS
jgi:hypothetical protein